MKIIFAITLFIASVVNNDPCIESEQVCRDISQYLPDSGDLEEWEPASLPQRFMGKGLYDLIDGGADIYYEYGFKQVITQEYVNADEKSITLELYEMKHPVAAYGIYTFMTGTDGEEIDVGTEALFEGSYLNFWKGQYLVTITGWGPDEEIIKSLLAIAKVVDSKIEKQGLRPSIINILPKDGLKKSAITYIKGVLALFNNYSFSSENIFGLREGVIGDYEDYSIFVFKYKDDDERLKWFNKAVDYLGDSDDFGDFKHTAETFSMKDTQGMHIYCKSFQNYLFIYVGTEENDPQLLLKELENNIP